MTDEPPLVSARLLLVVGIAVSVVDAVSERGSTVLGHILVAAQNMLLGILCPSRVGVGPRCTELTGRLVLICEEGLVPPINTIVQKTFAPMCSQRKDTGTKGELAAYLAVPGQVDLECF